MSERDRLKSSTSKHQQHTYEGSFDFNSPRPPVPGEEKPLYSSSSWTLQQMEWPKQKSSSPVPRKLSNFPNDGNAAPFGYEPEGSCRPRYDRPAENASPPGCVRWAQSLHALLQDPDGIKLFKSYLQSEGQQHADALDFWFACEGLRKQKELEKIQQLMKVIYKKFFLKSALPIQDDLRREIARNVKSMQCPDLPVTVFDEAQSQVESLISKTTYPNFIKSDMYLQYIESVQNPSSSSSEFSSDMVHFNTGMDLLPTLHEDMELVTNPHMQLSHTSGTGSVSTGYHTPNVSGAPARLTKDLLLMSQKHRAVDVRPKSEAFASMMYRTNGAHAAYNSYNPVSRQDSEMQSVSSHSDARTESDNMSLTDSSIDGRSMGRTSRRQAAIEAKHVRESAALNRETHMHQTVIPRTQRMDSRQCQTMNPKQFASILIKKLEAVQKQQEIQELFDKKIKESESMSSIDKIRMGDVQSRELANAIREKLQLEDDNDQDILDQHVSRVFSDLTPAARSPGIASPRLHSPPRNRHVPNPYVRPRKKDKDGFSTFSSDSGNVHDFAEGSEHKLAMVKSKSMTDYDERFVRNSSSRRSSSKKALTELTDSGVSVVSDTPPVNVPGKDNRVLAWLMESDKSGRGASHTHSEMSLKHRSHRTSSATSPNASRRRKGFGSRSNSLERNSVGGALGPAQPFVADPNMPPMPPPNTTVQLEEARRRLLLEERARQRSSNRHFPEASQSSQSTLRRSMRGARASLPVATNPTTPEDITTVVFSFCDEQFPYRTKIPGTEVTLRQFKEVLPKKGNYRFFFKTVCEDLGNQVIQEEVSNDNDILPLWEGKVMAQVKPVD